MAPATTSPTSFSAVANGKLHVIAKDDSHAPTDRSDDEVHLSSADVIDLEHRFGAHK